MGRTKIPKKLRLAVTSRAQERCEFCLVRKRLVYGLMEVDHIIPESVGGATNLANLCLTCRWCNNFKANQTHERDPLTKRRVRLFHPRTQKWNRHFQWDESHIRIEGRTACGRATVSALHLNNPKACASRAEWLWLGLRPPF